MSVAELTAKVRDSTVVISVMGRDGERSSLGAGFAVAKDGLIATNLHVIGEARPIVVTTADARRFDVTAIYATDQAMDLAVIRVEAKDLKPLELGDSDSIKQGQEVVAIGNPRGLEHSVVSGVISGIRKIDGKPLIQLAMPIEQGNSGGPVLDRRGRVLGLVTMKSVVSENLGFAVAVNALKPLLKKPNPVPIDRWLTIGALDRNRVDSRCSAATGGSGRDASWSRANGQRFRRTHASGLEACPCRSGRSRSPCGFAFSRRTGRRAWRSISTTCTAITAFIRATAASGSPGSTVPTSIRGTC